MLNVLKGLFMFSVSIVAIASVQTINGETASNLRSSLINSGAEATVLTDASIVSVIKLKCSQEGGFILMPVKCSFVDNNSGRLEEVTGDKANSLFQSLKDAGVKAVVKRQSERTIVKASVRSVSCSTLAIPSMIGCEIKK